MPVQSPVERGIMLLEQQLPEAAEGAATLDMGGMPTDEQLAAMGMDEATARGIQSLAWLSAEDSPARQHAVEAMIDLAEGEFLLPFRQNSKMMGG